MTSKDNSTKNMGKGDRLAKLELFRLQMLEEDTQKRFEDKAKQVEQERLVDVEKALIATQKANLAQFGLEQVEQVEQMEDEKNQDQTDLDLAFKEKWQEDIKLAEKARRRSFVPIDNRREWSEQEKIRLAEYRQKLEQKRILQQIQREQELKQEQILQQIQRVKETEQK